MRDVSRRHAKASPLPKRVDDNQRTGDAYQHTGWSWYVFGRVGGRLVEHDMFLDGSNYDNPSLSVDKEPAVGEAQAGITASYRPNANHRFDLSAHFPTPS